MLFRSLSYVKQYNGKPDKAGNVPYDFNSLNVIARQETNDPSRDQEGPRATPMRDILKDPNATDDAKFQAWRDAMSPELSDDEVRDLMHKAQQRMADPKFGKKVKESNSNALADTAKRLTNPNDGKVAKLRAAGDKRREEHLKSRDIAKKNEDVNLVKYANKVIREMRASEFIRQQLSELSVKPDMPLHADLEQHGQGVYLARDVGGYDRVYHMNRLWMAMAMADGKTKGKIPGAMASSWSEKYNTIHPFSDADNLKIQAALKTIPSDHGHISSSDHKSKEHDDVNKVSPVAKPKRNKYGV